MPGIFSLEDNIYVLKIEDSIDAFTIENVSKRLESASTRLVFSKLETEGTNNQSFLVISYKSQTGIKHWQTWLNVQLFVEFYKNLIVHIDEEKNIYRCCGPICTNLPGATDGFILLSGEPVAMSRTDAESAILNEGKKKIFRIGSERKPVISLLYKGRVEHRPLTDTQKDQFRHVQVPAAIISQQFETLELDKWTTLQEIRPNKVKKVFSLITLCKYRVKSLWQAGRISSAQINNLPIDTFDDLKAQVLFGTNIQLHFNFFKEWLKQHSDYSNYGSDILTGTFGLKGQARAIGAPLLLHKFPFEVNWFFQRFEVFSLDISDINKVQIVALCKILLQKSWVSYKVESCVTDLGTVKHLLLCCYAANYLEKQLKNIVNLLKTDNPQKEELISLQLTSLQEDLRQIKSTINIDTSCIDNLIKLQCDYINIYPKASEEKIFLWLGDIIRHEAEIKNIILLVESKKLLDEKNLQLLLSEQELQFTQDNSELTSFRQPEM